jgi:hypothetical protein
VGGRWVLADGWCLVHGLISSFGFPWVVGEIVVR